MTRVVSGSLRAHQAEQELQLQLISDLRGDTWDDGQSPPLGLELTGYRLFTTSVILGVGIPKAVSAHNGQSLISPTLDWIGGIIFAIIFFWLGEIGTNRPESFPLFFQTDFAPLILKFIRRREVILCFISVLPLLLTTKQVQAVLDVRRDDGQASGIPAHLIKDRFTVAVTAFSTAMLLFGSQCLGIVWPRQFQAYFGLLYSISSVIWGGYIVYIMCVLGPWRSMNDYQWLTLEMAFHNMFSISPHVLLAPCFHLHDLENTGLTSVCLIANLVVVAYIIFNEALLTRIFGFPDFPGGLYGLSFSCCMMVFLSAQFLALIPTSRVPFLSRAWRRLKVTYGRTRRAGRNAWMSVSGRRRA